MSDPTITWDPPIPRIPPEKLGLLPRAMDTLQRQLPQWCHSHGSGQCPEARVSVESVESLGGFYELDDRHRHGFVLAWLVVTGTWLL